MFKKLVTFLSLFTSAGTLICCAIPALLVALGLGASLAGFVSNFPQVIWLSEKKIWIFMGGGILLLLGGYLQYQSKRLDCPTDPAQRDTCQTGKNWSSKIYGLSLALYLIGVFFAFVAPLFL